MKTLTGTERQAGLFARTYVAAILLLLVFCLPAWGAATCTEFVNDGGFEYEVDPYVPSWLQASTTFGSPLCDFETCGLNLPRTGTWWAWFGGTYGTEREIGTLEQTMTLPAVALLPLRFYLWSEESGISGASDYIRITLDGSILFETTASDSRYQEGYTPVTINLSAFADGKLHKLRFESVIDSTSSFFVDDVHRPNSMFVNTTRTVNFAGDLLQPVIDSTLPAQEIRGQIHTGTEDILINLDNPDSVLTLKGGYGCDFAGTPATGSSTIIRSLEVRSGTVFASNISVASPASMTGLVIKPGGKVLARNLVLKESP